MKTESVVQRVVVSRSGLPIVTAFVLCLLTAASANAESPELRTPNPVIYLADNLDEQDKLGWCIDTLGRGWSEQLQTHSCKPQGGDVQFVYNEDSGQIESAEFAGKCATLRSAAATGVQFDLLDCDAASGTQQFTYDADTLAFSPAADSSLCIAAGAQSRSAGPFMSRILELAPCMSTDASLRQWIIRDAQ